MLFVSLFVFLFVVVCLLVPAFVLVISSLRVREFCAMSAKYNFLMIIVSVVSLLTR